MLPSASEVLQAAYRRTSACRVRFPVALTEISCILHCRVQQVKRNSHVSVVDCTTPRVRFHVGHFPLCLRSLTRVNLLIAPVSVGYSICGKFICRSSGRSQQQSVRREREYGGECRTSLNGYHGLCSSTNKDQLRGERYSVLLERLFGTLCPTTVID